MRLEQLFSLKASEIFSLFLSLPMTLYVNFRCLPFRTALKLPLFVGYRTRIDQLSKNITFGCEPSTFMVRIGWGGTAGRETGKRNYLHLNENASIRFNGRCTMSSGVSLILDLGKLEIGENFYCNKNCTISCNDHIVIGDGVLFGWNVELLDSDNHQVIHPHKPPAPGRGPHQNRRSRVGGCVFSCFEEQHHPGWQYCCLPQRCNRAVCGGKTAAGGLPGEGAGRTDRMDMVREGCDGHARESAAGKYYYAGI